MIEKFDIWLDKRRYIKKKKDRVKIIKLYQKCVNEEHSIQYFEKELEKLGWSEITINSISNYVLYPQYRYNENKKMED